MSIPTITNIAKASINNLTQAALRKEAARLSANIAARAARIADRGIKTNAMDTFEQVRQLRPETNNQLRSKVAQLRRLDVAPGTRLATAERVASREATIAANAARREATAATLRADRRSLPDKGDLNDLYAHLRRSVGRKVNAIKSDENLKGSPATEQFDRLMSERDAHLSPRQKARAARRLLDIADMKSLDPVNARKIHEDGANTFGDDYWGWSNEERTAVWEGFHRLAESQFQSLSSNDVKAIVEGSTFNGKLAVVFSTVKTRNDKGDLVETLRADVHTSLAKAQQESAIFKRRSEIAEQMMARSARVVF